MRAVGLLGWMVLGAAVSASIAQDADQEQSPRADAPETAPAEGLPVGLCCSEEMGFVCEVDSWEKCEPNAYADIVRQAAVAWPDEARRIGPYITPELARRLSRWARKEMEGYAEVSPLEPIVFKPVSHYPPRKKIVLQGTVDTLPTHAPLVTRWLQVYVLWDIPGKTIEHVTVTIRGERLE